MRDSMVDQQKWDLDMETAALSSCSWKMFRKEKMLAIREIVLEAGEKALEATLQSRSFENRSRQIHDQELRQSDIGGKSIDEEGLDGGHGHKDADERVHDDLGDMHFEDSYSIIMTPTSNEDGNEKWTEDA